MKHELVRGGILTGIQKDFSGVALPDFSDHPTKSKWMWLPVVRNDDVLGPGQIHNGERKAIENGRVVYRRNARDRTPAEIRAADFNRLRAATGNTILLLIRLIDWMLANTAIRASDFSPAVRQAYQDAKTIADRLDPP